MLSARQLALGEIHSYRFEKPVPGFGLNPVRVQAGAAVLHPVPGEHNCITKGDTPCRLSRTSQPWFHPDERSVNPPVIPIAKSCKTVRDEGFPRNR